MSFISDFRSALKKREDKNNLSYDIKIETDNALESIESLVGSHIPRSAKEMYTAFNGVYIYKPRSFELLNTIDIELFDNRYLIFALMDKEVRICFDTSCINNAGEWDIINYNDKYLITKTLASFITNKVWAWIDRGRIVWKEERF